MQSDHILREPWQSLTLNFLVCEKCFQVVFLCGKQGFEIDFRNSRNYRIIADDGSVPTLSGAELVEVGKPNFNLSEGCGSPVVKVSNHGRHVMSSVPVPLKTRRVGQRCTLNLSRAETSSSWCGVVVREGVPAQVSSTSLDHGSKLRGPSPKALV
ncbi:uncharacterized protein TNCV_2095091 [Trichonephila clavipes]|nr:uncharacterized protein TNCV_2095091 [Trichonephila clavipes]